MLTPEFQRALKKLIERHEGKRQYPYVDTVGKVTIGYGYNLSDRGLPESWINKQYDDDVNYFYQQLAQQFIWFVELHPVRQIVLIDMAFMGLKKLMTFRRMLNYLSIHDYPDAAAEMLDSLWAKQVGKRAIELAQIMERGTLNECT